LFEVSAKAREQWDRSDKGYVRLTVANARKGMR
jgi:hypothetical protein